MLTRTLLISAALLIVAPATYADTKAKQYHIELALKRGDPLGSPQAGTVEVLTRPQVRTLEKQAARVVVGQSVPVGDNKSIEFLEVGHSITVLPEPTEGGTIRLRIEVELSELKARGDDHAAVRADRYLCVREVTPGELMRIRLGPRAKTETWLEVTAREVKE